MLRRVGQQDIRSSVPWLCHDTTLLALIYLPLGFFKCKYDSHENVPHRPSSTGRVINQETQLLTFEIYHPSSHWLSLFPFS